MYFSTLATTCGCCFFYNRKFRNSLLYKKQNLNVRAKFSAKGGNVHGNISENATTASWGERRSRFVSGIIKMLRLRSA